MTMGVKRLFLAIALLCINVQAGFADPDPANNLNKLGQDLTSSIWNFVGQGRSCMYNGELFNNGEIVAVAEEACVKIVCQVASGSKLSRSNLKLEPLENCQCRLLTPRTLGLPFLSGFKKTLMNTLKKMPTKFDLKQSTNFNTEEGCYFNGRLVLTGGIADSAQLGCAELKCEKTALDGSSELSAYANQECSCSVVMTTPMPPTGMMTDGTTTGMMTDGTTTGMMTNGTTTGMMTNGTTTGMMTDGTTTGMMTDGTTTGMMTDGTTTGMMTDGTTTGMMTDGTTTGMMTDGTTTWMMTDGSTPGMTTDGSTTGMMTDGTTTEMMTNGTTTGMMTNITTTGMMTDGTTTGMMTDGTTTGMMTVGTTTGMMTDGMTTQKMINFPTPIPASTNAAPTPSPCVRYEQFSQLHTMCLPPNPRCSVRKSGIRAAEKNAILNSHNFIRALMATGVAEAGSNGTLPSSSNMKELKWNQELADIALAWSRQCPSDHDCYNCRVPVTRTYSATGQNIYKTFGIQGSVDPDVTSLLGNIPKWEEAIGAWSNESVHIDRGIIRAFQPKVEGKVVGHFSQLVWAKTFEIGCGSTTYGPCTDEAGTGLFTQCQVFVCNYGPAGNYIGERVYAEGVPASKCEKGQSSLLAGLCIP